MEAMFVGLIAYGVFALTTGWAMTIIMAMQDGTRAFSPAQVQVFGAAYIVASPLTIAVLWIAIRRAGRDFTEYLALNWPSSGQLLRALAITAIFLVVESLAISFVGADETWHYVSGKQLSESLIFLIAACIADPIMEEFVVRGFMFRGWSQSFLGPVGAILLTSVLWAMIHIQYDWFGRFWIFVTGLVLGHFRWRSNSTWLTVMVHSAINITLFFAAGLSL
jgi:membrane protease YdiL (CAAX protease family)